MNRHLLLLFALLFAGSASAANQLTDIACETSTTTGTGTLNLAGAKTGGYLGFAAAGVTSGNSVPYSIVTGTGLTRKLETGIGVFTDASPDTLTRVADWSTDGTGAELNLSETSTVCVGVNAAFLRLGAGNTIDADKLDGITSSDFLTEAEAAAAYEPLGVTLGTDTTGDYVAGVADGTGIDGTATGEGSTYTPTFDATELTGTTTFGNGSASTIVAGDVQSGDDILVGDDVTLSAVDGVVSIGADTTFTRVDASDSLVINTDVDNDAASSVISLGVDGSGEALLSGTAFYPGANDGNALGQSGNAWADMWLASGGTIEWDGGTSNTQTCTAGSCTIEGNVMYRAGGTDVAVADGGTGASSLSDLITLTTMTAGVYVAQVADGTGVDGSCNAEGCTYTPTLDLTELSTATFGAGSFTALTFDAGATDPVFTFGSNSIAVTGAATVTFSGSLDLSGVTTATLTASSANLLVEGSIVKKVGKQTRWVPASAMAPRVTNGCAPSIRETNSITISVMACDTTTDEAAQFTVAFPKSWNLGTITFQPFWTAAAGTATNTVDWELSCAALSNDDAITSATLGTAVAVNDALIATNDVHVGSESAAVTIGGTPAADDLVICQILRDVSDDTIANDVELIGLKLFYTDSAATDD
jgi:hypothetical protein